MSDESRGRGLFAIALLLSLAALAFATLAYFRAEKRNAELADELKALQTAGAETKAEAQHVMARMQSLEERLAEMSARRPAEAGDLRGIISAQLRESLLRTTGRAPIDPADLPPEIRDAAAAAIPGLDITRAEMRRRDGGFEYRLHGHRDGRDYGLRLNAQGQVLETDLPPELVAQPVRDAALRVVPGIQLTGAEQRMDEGRTVFDLQGRLGGQEFDMRIAADGTVLEAELPPAAMPVPVREVVLKTVEGLELRRARIEQDDGQGVYEVHGHLGREEFDLRVDEAGKLLAMELPTVRVPQVVLDAALKAVPGVQLSRQANRRTENGQTVYDLEGRLGRRDVSFQIAEDGRLIEVDGVEDARGGNGGGGAVRPPAPPDKTQF